MTGKVAPIGLLGHQEVDRHWSWQTAESGVAPPTRKRSGRARPYGLMGGSASHLRGGGGGWSRAAGVARPMRTAPAPPAGRVVAP